MDYDYVSLYKNRLFLCALPPLKMYPTFFLIQLIYSAEELCIEYAYFVEYQKYFKTVCLYPSFSFLLAKLNFSLVFLAIYYKTNFLFHINTHKFSNTALLEF